MYIFAFILCGACSFLGVMIHPIVGIALPIGALLGCFVFSQAFTLLLAFMLVLFTRPAEFFPVLSMFQMGKIFSLASLGYFAASKMLRQEISWTASKHNFWIIWLTLAVFFSSQLGTDRGASMATFKDVFVKILILYLLILNLVDIYSNSVLPYRNIE